MNLDIAWAAGFLDGEASFLLSALPKKQQKVRGVILRRPIISASQSLTITPLLKLKQALGGSVCEAKRKTVTGRKVWIWCLAGGKALREVLPKLIPHLTVKLESAKLLLAFAETMQTNKDPRSQELIELRNVIITKFYALPERKKPTRKRKKA